MVFEERVMILHVMSREKFTQPFIDFIKNNFDIDEHLFIVINKNTSQYHLDTTLNNVIEISNYNFSVIKFIYYLQISNRIIIHGLNSKIVSLLFFVQPWILKKTSWLIWGADLYDFNKVSKTFLDKIYKKIKTFIVKRFYSIIAYASGDYNLAVRYYGVKGKFEKCLYYPYFAVEDYLDNIVIDRSKVENIIMVGNSADSTNEHLEIFEKLLKIPNINEYKILVPLSYGGTTSYVNRVIQRGENYFGDNFIALTTFMDSKDYYHLLSKVKVVIMGHKRQQATGNILALIKFSKKIFIRTDISTWNFYQENNIKMFDYSKIEEELLLDMQDEDIRRNELAIKSYFTNKRVINDWINIFNGVKKK
jgi:dTDP-N-acetylfucosamine:lipid II N-acetylfucosaminyltransferase